MIFGETQECHVVFELSVMTLNSNLLEHKLTSTKFI